MFVIPQHLILRVLTLFQIITIVAGELEGVGEKHIFLNNFKGYFGRCLKAYVLKYF
jgi:hypothetical protein